MSGFDISTLSAAKLAMLFNAVTTGAPVKKFESTPRALEHTRAELAAAGVTATEAARRVGLLPGPAATKPAAPQPAPEATRAPGAFEAMDLVTGRVVPLRSLHDPLRRVDGDPEKAARKVAAAAVAHYRAARQPAASAAPATVAAVLPADGPARSNRTLPAVLDALRGPGGVTLAELTTVAGWRAPFELSNLRIAARKQGFAVAHDDGEGAARRYWIAGLTR